MCYTSATTLKIFEKKIFTKKNCYNENNSHTFLLIKSTNLYKNANTNKVMTLGCASEVIRALDLAIIYKTMLHRVVDSVETM